MVEVLLVIDAGNTNIVLGLFAGEQLQEVWRLANAKNRTADEYGLLATQLLRNSGYTTSDIDGVAISSVSPIAGPVLVQMVQRFFRCEPLTISGETKTPLKVRYNPPISLGSDRLTNSVAAASIYGLPVIVVDFGTATTIDCVSAQGEFLGGVIAPGITTMQQALTLAAPGLPKVPLKGSSTAIGTNTTECMQSGLVRYAAAAIDGLVRQAKAEMAANPTVVATGGLVSVIAGVSSEIQHTDEHLTLHGIRLIYTGQR